MFPRKLTKQVICTADYPMVMTRQGKLRGMVIEGTFVFRGVAYAKAERFQMPKRPEPWDGVKDALAFGPVCPELATGVMEWDGYAVPNYWYPQEEECQFLNIWTRHLDPEAKRPVMVWFHGGAYHKCSGINCFSYDGSALSEFGDVVVVNVCHRLHALGFLDLSEYGDEYKNAGNLGMADLVKALEWIQENIRGFGGDPEKVMLFGQSGGGGKIAALMQIPAADGLFAAASMQSGGCDTGNNGGHSHEYAGRMTRMILEELQISGEAGIGKTSASVSDCVEKLKRVPYYRFAKAVVDATARWRQETGENYKWQPLIGDYFVGHPMNVGFRRENLQLPLLVGNCFGEFANNLHLNPAGCDGDGHKNTWSEEVCIRKYKEKYGQAADGILRRFREAYPDKPICDGLFFDPVWRNDTILFCEKRAKQGSLTTYNWLMTLELPSDGGCVSYHQAEQPFVFHETEYFESSYMPGVSEALQDKMARAWVSLAEYGNPNMGCRVGQGSQNTAIGMRRGKRDAAAGIEWKNQNVAADGGRLPEWNPVKAGAPLQTMIFDKECRVVYDHDKKLIEEMSSVTDFGNYGPNQAAYGGGPRGRR